MTKGIKAGDYLTELRRHAEEIRDREAIRVFRLHRRAKQHGCSLDLCSEILNEGWLLQNMRAEILLDPYIIFKFKYGFK